MAEQSQAPKTIAAPTFKTKLEQLLEENYEIAKYRNEWHNKDWQLYQNYQVNPSRKLRSLFPTRKVNTRPDPKEAEALCTPYHYHIHDVISRYYTSPPCKQRAPLTSNQEIGWFMNDPEVVRSSYHGDDPCDDRFNFRRVSDKYIKVQGQVIAMNREKAAAVAGVQKGQAAAAR